MLENRDNFALFRAKGNRDMYELLITLVDRNQEEIEIKEMIDAYPGEVGRRYASNLLFRLGNEMVKGTELEDISWKKVVMDSSVEEQEFGYMKRGEDGNRLFAFAKWKSIKAENV